MEYSRIIQDAWRLTWRYRFLWLFGLFASTSAGTCHLNVGAPGGNLPTGGPGGPLEGQPLDPELLQRLQEATRDIGKFLLDNLAGIVVLVMILLTFALVLFLLSLFCKGALLGALGRLGQGHRSTMAEASDSGRRCFARYLSLSLLLFGVFLVIALVVGLCVLAAMALGGGPLIGLLVVLGVLVGLAAIPIAIAFGIVLLYTDLAIAVDDQPVIESIGRGVRLLTGQFGSSLLLWLIGIAIGIAVGIGLFLVVLALLIPFGVVGAILYATGGFSGLLLVYALVAGFVLVAVLWAVSAVVNTYTAAYWTLGYLNLTERYTPLPRPLP